MKSISIFSLRKLLTVLVICIMTINAIGIAQVTHMCKMAASQVTSTGCKDEGCGEHECCPVASNEDCCTDIVKYYRQKVNTTLNPVFKLFPEPALVTLLISFIPEPEAYNNSCVPSHEFLVRNNPGRLVLIEKHTFLI